jgi:hypothetical protein
MLCNQSHLGTKRKSSRRGLAEMRMQMACEWYEHPLRRRVNKNSNKFKIKFLINSLSNLTKIVGLWSKDEAEGVNQ